MLLILLSWIYIFITATSFGILFKKGFKIQNCHVVTHQILGLFLYTIITCIFAFFIRINIEYYIGVLAVNFIVFYRFWKIIKEYLIAILTAFQSLQLKYKLLYILLLIVVLAKSSTKPYLLDNESYYIQTIKWINEYGYVRGLANLHMFFGQNSVWHTLQAGFNFSFVIDFFNDLNGYLFSVVGLLAIDKLNGYNEAKNRYDLSFGLILVFSLFLMQFVNAPSPDLIIFLIAPYVIYLFLTKYNSLTKNDFKIILSLTLFLCFVKVTIALLSILIIILFVKHFKYLKTEILKYTVLSGVVLILFLLKNAVISGYLLYPISAFDVLNVEWKQPIKLLELYELGTYLSGMDSPDVIDLGLFEKIIFWLTAPKLDGLFNKLYIFLLAVFPFVIFKRKEKIGLIIVYILAILQIVLLWNNSPQYRFFFVFIIFLSIELVTSIIKSKNLLNYLVSFMVAISAMPLFVSVNLSTFTNNKFTMNLSEFKLKNTLTPEGISKTETQFSKESINNLKFNSPSDDVFFWSTGNGDLPCVNKKQIDYIKDFYNYIPQMRTEKLKDGFKSVLVED